MEGVLERSTQGDERRWTAHHGLSDIFDLRRTHGRRGADTIREYLSDISGAAVADHVAQLDAIASQKQSDVVAYARVIELLASIPPYRWTIVPSASEKMMRSRLAAAGIMAPKHTVGGDTVSVGKPHPEGYLRIRRPRGFAHR